MAAKPKDALAEVFAKAQKKSGLLVGPLGTMAGDTKWIPSGNIAIDNAFGGGIPLGRSIELFGPPSSGKTTCALQSAIALQKIIKAGGDPSRGIKADDVILYLDYEQAMDMNYARSLGLDVEHESFLFSQPDTLEEGMDLALDAVKTGRVRLTIVDSVASMVPSAQAEADSVSKVLPAITARLLKTTGQNFNPVLRHNNSSIIWINHEMEIMAMGGPASYGPPPTTTPGGKSIKYFASVRGQFRQIKTHKGPWTDPLTGEIREIPMMTDVRLRVVKNKVASPFREAILRVRFGRGFDNFWTTMQILLANKQVVYSGSRYYFHRLVEQGGAPDWMPREKEGTQRPAIHGEKGLFRQADAHPEWRDTLIELATKIANENIANLALVVTTSPIEEQVEDDEEESQTQDLDELLDSKSAGKRVKI